VSIPPGIRKAVRDGTPFDTWTSGAIIVGYAIPGFLFAILLIVLFAGGPTGASSRCGASPRTTGRTCRSIGKVLDYLWHIAAGAGLDHLGLRHADAADEEQLPRRDQEAVRDDRPRQGPVGAARALRPRLPQRHADRDRGLPGLFIGVFFGGSLIIETLFSLDGLGRLGFEAAVARDYPVVFGTLFAFSLLGLLVGIISDITYVPGGPPHRFREPRMTDTRPNIQPPLIPEPMPGQIPRRSSRCPSPWARRCRGDP
jgi:microcin C transport system permease protein